MYNDYLDKRKVVSQGLDLKKVEKETLQKFYSAIDFNVEKYAASKGVTVRTLVTDQDGHMKQVSKSCEEFWHNGNKIFYSEYINNEVEIKALVSDLLC